MTYPHTHHPSRLVRYFALTTSLLLILLLLPIGLLYASAVLAVEAYGALLHDLADELPEAKRGVALWRAKTFTFKEWLRYYRDVATNAVLSPADAIRGHSF